MFGVFQGKNNSLQHEWRVWILIMMQYHYFVIFVFSKFSKLSQNLFWNAFAAVRPFIKSSMPSKSYLLNLFITYLNLPNVNSPWSETTTTGMLLSSMSRFPERGMNMYTLYLF